MAWRHGAMVVGVAVVAACGASASQTSAAATAGGAGSGETTVPVGALSNGAATETPITVAVVEEIRATLPQAIRDSGTLSVGSGSLPAGAVLFPGHGEPIDDHRSLIDTRFASTERRKEKLLRLLADGPRSGYELAQSMWGNIAVTQAFLTLSEVIGHMDLLVAEGRVREVDDGGVIRFEAVT